MWESRRRRREEETCGKPQRARTNRGDRRDRKDGARSLESEDGAHLRELLSASVDGVEQVQ